MLRIIHYLLLVLIYISFFYGNPLVFSVPVKKVAFFAILLLFFLYIFLHAVELSKALIHYLLATLFLMLFLVVVSLLKGNDLSNILFFFSSILFIVIIPIISVLIRGRFTIETYIRHMLIGGVALSVVILLFAAAILAFDLMNNKIVFMQFNAAQSEWAISFPEDGIPIRIQVNTAIMLIPSITIAVWKYAKTKKRSYFWATVLMGVALIFTQSTAIWGGALVSYLLFSFFEKKISFRTILLFIVFSSLAFFLYSVMSKYKETSMNIKQQQSTFAVNCFYDNPVLGMGIGHLFRSFDVRGIDDIVMEVAPSLLIAMGGIVGSLIYFYVYFFWIVEYIRRGKFTYASIMASSHIGIIVASLGNPYIWAGSQGLLFSCFLAALLDEQTITSNKNRTPSERPVIASGSHLPGVGAEQS